MVCTMKKKKGIYTAKERYGIYKGNVFYRGMVWGQSGNPSSNEKQRPLCWVTRESVLGRLVRGR